MRRWAFALLLLGNASAAHAGDKVLIQPVPAWVTPVETAPAPKPQADAPMTVLLSDQQVRLERGRVTTFQRTSLRIDNAQGLSAGNISLPWRPEIGDLRVHQLVLHRGERVLDVLASGQTFTVARREPNLEAASLDGVLTANIQVEGLEVGDILELRYSVTAEDPVLAGHVEARLTPDSPVPLARAHVRASWPRTLAIKTKANGPLAGLKPSTVGADQVLETTLDSVQPYVGPKYAPARYQIGRLIELTDYSSWSDLGVLMAPLYDKAAVLSASGPLADEVARIKAASSDPKTRATVALALVQDRIRYVGLSMGAGGLVPADAATTWSRRYGDCKGKTVLLLAILRALDIVAEPVAANLGGGDGIDARLPAVDAFNHVLVRATIAGKVYWLDGTRTGDTALDRLTVPYLGWGLPLVAGGAALVPMVPPPLTEPTSDTAVTIDASAGIGVPAPFEATVVLRGDEAIGTNVGLGSLVGEARDRALRNYWKASYDFVEIGTVSTSFDRASGELRLTMKGTAKLDFSRGQYETDGLDVGFKADFTREAGPYRDAPYVVSFPAFSRNSETIKLPVGFPDSVKLDKVAIDQTIAGVEYRRTASIDTRVFHAVTTRRAVAPEFPASQAPAAQTALRALADDTLWVRVPSSYRWTDGDLAAMQKTTPATAAAFTDRGSALLDRQRYDDAIKDFDAALALEPNNALALADRGVARVWRDQPSEAEKDFATAERLDPNSLVAMHGRGLAAERRSDYPVAIAMYSKAIARDPRDKFALWHRVTAYRALNNQAGAFADTDVLLALDSRDGQLRLIRANILRLQGKTDAALAEVRAAIAAAPDDTYAYVAAANANLAWGSREEALRLFDRALEIKRESFIYVNRAMARPSTDLVGRRTDYDAALALDPKSVDALVGNAETVGRLGDWGKAVGLVDQALMEQPDDPDLLTQRGAAHWLGGNRVAAEKDFASARTLAKTATMLNGLCWAKATLGVALERALEECDAALAREPKSAGILDSKGLVLLRLGRFDDAIAAYDQAVVIAPTQASSLYGRGIAYARKGNPIRSTSDLSAARKASNTIEDRFADYGIHL